MIPIILVFGVVASMIYGYFFGVRAAMFFWLGHIIVVIVYAAQHCLHTDACPECEGRGWIPNGEPDDCDVCNGTGKRG